MFFPSPGWRNVNDGVLIGIGSRRELRLELRRDPDRRDPVVLRGARIVDDGRARLGRSCRYGARHSFLLSGKLADLLCRPVLAHEDAISSKRGPRILSMLSMSRRACGCGWGARRQQLKAVMHGPLSAARAPTRRPSTVLGVRELGPVNVSGSTVKQEQPWLTVCNALCSAICRVTYPHTYVVMISY